MMKAYRKGAIGALMDEYERAASELKLLIGQTSDDKYARIIDTQSKDEDCRSIQTIMTHVVKAGYGYANYIREHFSIASTSSATGPLSREYAVAELETMLGYTAETLDGKWEMTDEEIDGITIHSRWGVDYTLEQLLEHAIVHILRHRRQIERLLGRDEVTAPPGV
jgi:uncharacterized damage-inducible protein DinB